MRGTAFALFAVTLVAVPAAASPCADRVAMLEKRYASTTGDAAAAKPDVQGTAPESVDARLHHQPTQGSVASAGSAADSPEAVRRARFQVYLEQARAAADAGDVKECEASANEAEKAMR